MEYGNCDNVDCKSNKVKENLYLTVLHREFDYDIVFWCSECIRTENKIIYMSEMDSIHRK
jgi:hypothetical protein